MLRTDYKNILNDICNLIDDELLKILNNTILKNDAVLKLTNIVGEKLAEIHPVFWGEEELKSNYELKFSYLTLLNNYTIYKVSELIKEYELKDKQIKCLVEEMCIPVFKKTSEEYSKVNDEYTRKKEDEIEGLCNRIISYLSVCDVRNPFEEIGNTIDRLDWFLRFLANLRHFNIEIPNELALDYFIDRFDDNQNIYARLKMVRHFCYDKELIERLKFLFDHNFTLSAARYEDKKNWLRYLTDSDKEECSEELTHKNWIETFDEYILYVVKSLLDENKKVFICEYCNNPYIAVRKDSNYCNYPYRHGVKKTCMEFVSQNKCKKKEEYG